MPKTAILPIRKCAIYTRKSSEEGLEQEFNSLDAQRESCEAYIRSQKQEGWELIPTHYDDGGYSGGNTARPALVQLRKDIGDGLVDIVLVYKVDRLSRSLSDFVQLVAFFDQQEVAFAAVTQQFNTSTSMGRLTLNVLLSFAQFEREVTSERIRDKIAASKKKGLWMGGRTPLGYQVQERKLMVVEADADLVRHIFDRYLTLRNVRNLKSELDRQGRGSPQNNTHFTRGALYTILKNPIYIGRIHHKGELFEGKHSPIVPADIWKDVQQQLVNNSQAQKEKGRNVSLLSGLLFDDKGNPMSPTHTRRRDKRYRYYVSQAVLQYREADLGSVQRISGPAVERLVLDMLKVVLTDGAQLVDLLQLADDSPTTLKRIIGGAQQSIDVCQDKPPAIQKAWLNSFCERIELAKTELSVTISLSKLKQMLGCMDEVASLSTHTLKQAVSLRRSGLESRLVIAGEATKASDSSISTLQEGVRKGLTWALSLRQGEYSSYQEIAADHGVKSGYVRRLCLLSLLAPEVLNAVVSGTVSDQLSLEILKKGIPSDWGTQRQRYLL